MKEKAIVVMVSGRRTNGHTQGSRQTEKDNKEGDDGSSATFLLNAYFRLDSFGIPCQCPCPSVSFKLESASMLNLGARFQGAIGSTLSVGWEFRKTRLELVFEIPQF